MDKVNFNPFSEILIEDFLRQGGYIGDAFKLMIADFLNQNTAVVGLEVKAQSVPDMTVYVKPGRAYQAGQQGQLTVNLDPALTITAAHPDYMRIDRVCARYNEIADTPETRNVMVDTVSRQVIQKTVMTRLSGAIDFMVISGVAAPGPAAPTVPDGWFSLAQVKVRAGASTILQSDILDERPTFKSLLTHAHSGGNDGAKVSYNSLLDKPEISRPFTWKAATNFGAGDICYPTSLSANSWMYLECIVGGVTGATEPAWGAAGDEITDNTVRWRVRDIKSGGGVGIGTVLPFLATHAQPGWLALDTGAEVSRATYPQLWEWVQANHPPITEAEWQAQSAVQSSVGYYSSGDGSTTFRLPRILDYPRGGLAGEAGHWQLHMIESHSHIERASPASTSTAYNLTIDHGGTGQDPLDMSYSTGSTGGEETRPNTIKFLFCVKSFDAPTNQGLIDITALSNEVLNKVSKTETGYRLRKWVSGEYTPVLNTPCIVNHGLDIDPENCIYDVRLKCAVAEGGYSIGDYAIGWYTTASIGSQGTTHHPVPKLTASEIQFNTGEYTSTTTNGIGMLNKNSGAYVKATLANWRYVFRIFY
jgi:hypothetical protein